MNHLKTHQTNPTTAQYRPVQSNTSTAQYSQVQPIPEPDPKPELFGQTRPEPDPKSKSPTRQTLMLTLYRPTLICAHLIYEVHSADSETDKGALQQPE